MGPYIYIYNDNDKILLWITFILFVKPYAYLEKYINGKYGAKKITKETYIKQAAAQNVRYTHIQIAKLDKAALEKIQIQIKIWWRKVNVHIPQWMCINLKYLPTQEWIGVFSDQHQTVHFEEWKKEMKIKKNSIIIKEIPKNREWGELQNTVG